ncbi:MAG: aldo/keto reductase [Planctomycetes bacterium]|nr:aldo/keto reductase [Planctomycetota bacterium]
MKTLTIGTLETSRIAYGCMPLAGWDAGAPAAPTRAKAVRAVRAAIDAGIDCFDHADIYCRGRSEAIFAEVLSDLGVGRERLRLQSKVGIRFADVPAGAPGRYDFSYQHIVSSCEATLQRLRTDYLDVYLLHRPDALVEPDEVARAFDELAGSGKVRQFGVSNHQPAQIELLRRSLRQPLVVNQVELSVVHSHLIDAGIVTNQSSVSYGADGTFDYCRLHGIRIQAWGPMASGRALGSISADAPPRDQELARVVRAIAATKGVQPEAIPIAWLLRHPAGIQPIIGSTDPARIAAATAADGIALSREEWYALHIAGRGSRLP